MDPTKLGLEALLDVFEEDALIRVMADMLQNIHDCVDDAGMHAVTLEKTIRQFLQMIDKQSDAVSQFSSRVLIIATWVNTEVFETRA